MEAEVPCPRCNHRQQRDGIWCRSAAAPAFLTGLPPLGCPTHPHTHTPPSPPHNPPCCCCARCGRFTNCFDPNINIFRDPRWGRGAETFGEDPLLTARMVTAYVRGLQYGAGAGPSEAGAGTRARQLSASSARGFLKASATCKHFAACECAAAAGPRCVLLVLLVYSSQGGAANGLGGGNCRCGAAFAQPVGDTWRLLLPLRPLGMCADSTAG